MKVLIIEDETTASENLVEMLKEIDPSIEVLHVLESVQQTVRWLNTNPAPDLIFMDIHLSDGSAFTLFSQIDVQTPIVFTTAYDQYALDAFTVNSIDYLLKPIKMAELTRALEKFKKWGKTDVIAYLEHMMKLNPEGQKPTGYKQVLLIGEQGIAQVDTKNRTIARSRPFSFKSVSISRADNYPCIFDNQGHMHIVKGYDQIETKKLPFKGQVTAYASSKSSNIKTYGMSDGTIYYVNPKGQIQKMVGHRSRISKIKIINWRIYSASYDGRVNLWLADQPKIEPMTIITTNGWIMNFTFDEKKEYLWCGDQKGTLTESLISVPMMRKMLKEKLKRNLTREEWDYYIGRNIPYEAFIGKEARP